MSRTFERMYNHGWIDVGPGKDRRSQSLKATPQGRQLLLKAAPVWHELQASVLDSAGENVGLLAAFGLGAQSAEIHNEEDDDDFYGDEFAADFYN